MSRHTHNRQARLPLPATREPRRDGERGIKKGTQDRRVIARLVVGDREFWLHSTKGYRSTRA